jgi:hypothetical protein
MTTVGAVSSIPSRRRQQEQEQRACLLSGRTDFDHQVESIDAVDLARYEVRLARPAIVRVAAGVIRILCMSRVQSYLHTPI